MILAHYSHRLPANYDIDLIRSRAKGRGSLWDNASDLYFKGFLLRERGQFGAIANNYSSLYLWRTEEAFLQFLTSGRFGGVTDAFGRAEIRTWFAVDALRGEAAAARFAYKEDSAIPIDADLKAVLAGEVERNRTIVKEAGTVAAVVGVDPETWTLTRVRLSTEPPTGAGDQGVAYEILHLASPLFETLAR